MKSRLPALLLAPFLLAPSLGATATSEERRPNLVLSLAEAPHIGEKPPGMPMHETSVKLPPVTEM